MRTSVVLLGLAFHIAFIYSIFDIYFTSPLVHGVPPVPVQINPPAQRLVFIVGDACRADKLFELDQVTHKSHTPFLRSIIDPKSPPPNFATHVHLRGSWGISHTRVPTESRPGHVAMFSGFYEDVAAVTKGWKANPCEFDSVFNRSTHSWGFGSPDVVPMFTHGVPQMRDFCYTPEFENWHENAWLTDEWVFQRMEELFQNATRDPVLNENLHKPGIIFFLHLLGLDTTGHVKRPNSPEYGEHLHYVDGQIQLLIAMMDRFYGEANAQTAYIFTGDHGMSNKGAHGDGDPDCTRTPLILWGAGARDPRLIADPEQQRRVHEDLVATHGWPTPDRFELRHTDRQDINQADMSLLISALLGHSPPVNSVGVLPRAHLDMPPADRARMAHANAQAVVAQYRHKAAQRLGAHRVARLFRPFPEEAALGQAMSHIGRLLAEGQHEQAEEASLQVVAMALRGLSYMQTYDRLVLFPVIALASLGWVLLLLSHVMGWPAGATAATEAEPLARRSLVFAALTAVPAAGYLVATGAPLIHYAYVAFPVLFWTMLVQRFPIRLLGGSGREPGALLSVGVLLLLPVLVLAYHHRELFALLFLALSLWPLLLPLDRRALPLRTRLLWTGSCLALAGCALAPIDLGERPLLRRAGAVLMVVVALATAWRRSLRAHALDVATVLLAAANMACAPLLPALVMHSISWLLLGSVWLRFFLVQPLRTRLWHAASPPRERRLLSMGLSFGGVLLLLGVNFEGLFYLAFMGACFAWLRVEQALEAASPITRPATAGPGGRWVAARLLPRDLWSALVFLCLFHISFFGTGNVASLSSFDVTSTLRFVSVFAPFTMAVLLVTKLLLPFSLIAAVLCAVVRGWRFVYREPRGALLPTECARTGPAATTGMLFATVLLQGDLMALGFFFMVRDTGSWLEIGLGISHFVIANCMALAAVGLYFLADRVLLA
ncbi:putative GPI ethanolamine phosphate transferase 1 [Paratrimastix pyriformis]|uniref:GPI ethanolamine phosphate transferase 1 n=1 Tax=Paratrimastix pyriformis TaxID=342808 RepID=A0ABQ8UNJ2_9EUKA|nr:putative GPI ethanolamine phosphate transferase 1 [Paratrimastix pyriformis]